MKKDRPVGFFDSGIGGSCILKAFRKLCPYEKTIYLADSANCPYGNKSAEEIVRLSEANVEKLLQANCKMIVVACNTATAAAIDTLRMKYHDVPFVGLEPATKLAALRSARGIVGVLATAGTFQGRLYNETKKKFAQNVTVLAVVADEFVTEVEKAYRGLEIDTILDRLDDPDNLAFLEPVVRRRLEPLLRAGADKIVLGCTHFPHLKPVIKKVCAAHAEVIDSSEAVAQQAKRVLAERGLLAEEAK